MLLTWQTLGFRSTPSNASLGHRTLIPSSPACSGQTRWPEPVLYADHGRPERAQYTLALLPENDPRRAELEARERLLHRVVTRRFPVDQRWDYRDELASDVPLVRKKKTE